MPSGRLIRLRKQGDPHGIAYIVAITDPIEAMGLIREKTGGTNNEITDFGRVSEEKRAPPVTTRDNRQSCRLRLYALAYLGIGHDPERTFAR